jgi:hypothetical protein
MLVEGHVDAEAHVGALPGLPGRLDGVRPVDEQAGARHDAAVERLEDAAVDLRGHPEVVGIDDGQPLLRVGIDRRLGGVRVFGPGQPGRDRLRSGHHAPKWASILT